MISHEFNIWINYYLSTMVNHKVNHKELMISHEPTINYYLSTVVHHHEPLGTIINQQLTTN